ncbi:hypothetical protein WN944_029557 [Citrus x changshan-huyou]|uniref:Uncharacterized protein n=1 Tax=Citrus x changshan-huyou TaxID=2935761 RepID=A0AAP0LQY9_9ROSI
MALSFISRRRRKQVRPGPKPYPVIGNLLEPGGKPHKSLANLTKIHGRIMSLKTWPATVESRSIKTSGARKSMTFSLLLKKIALRREFKDTIWGIMEEAEKPNLSDHFPLLKNVRGVGSLR